MNTATNNDSMPATSFPTIMAGRNSGPYASVNARCPAKTKDAETAYDQATKSIRYTIKADDLKGEGFMPFREIKKVIFNDPATVIIWSDNTKTVVKCEDGETYDKEKGFLLCWLKGIKGSKKLQKELAKWIYKED